MGAWSTSLYGSDDALDLRASIAAVCRLPHDGDRLVELLAGLHPEAGDPASEGHSTFWLVLADQFHKRGIRSIARARALAIIDDGSDLAMRAGLGVDGAGLRQRERVLGKLADELRSPLPEKPRKVLAKPQPLLFRAGDVLAFRVDGQGNCCNPYFPDPEAARFVPAGWDGCVIRACGLALDHFAWYAVGTTTGPWRDRPALERVVDGLDAKEESGVGTIPKRHVARMGLELLGNVRLPEAAPPPREAVMGATVADISISNALARWAKPGTLKFR